MAAKKSHFDPKVNQKLTAAQQKEYASITKALDSGKSTHQQNQRYNQLRTIASTGKQIAPPADTIPNQITPTQGQLPYPPLDTKSAAGLVNTQLGVNNYTSDVNLRNNRPDQSDQFGNTSSWGVDPNTGQWVQKTGAGTLSTAGQKTATDIFSGLNDGVNSDPRKTIQNAIYSNLTNGLDAQYTQQKSDLQQQLVNSGNGPGTPLFDKEMNNFENQFQSQRTLAQNQAIQGSGQEMAGEVGTALSASGIGAPNFQAFNQVTQTAPDVGQTYGQFGTVANTAQQNANTLSLGNAANANTAQGNADTLTVGLGANAVGMKNADVNALVTKYLIQKLSSGGTSGAESGAPTAQ